MRLLVDIGNTRIKWRLLGNTVVAGGALQHGDIAQLVGAVADHGVPSKVLVACVGKQELRDQIAAICRTWGASLLTAKTCAEQSGVYCGYRNPAQMGVDRWLAVIAAYNSLKAPCVVVDAGSAITVDVVGENGRHQGGYIVPGFQKMLNSLYWETNQVKVSTLVKLDRDAGIVPGLSTAEAVSYGFYAMVSGLINNAVAQFAGAIGASQVIVTGGDATLIEELGVECTLKENLVLDGLSIIAEQEKAAPC